MRRVSPDSGRQRAVQLGAEPDGGHGAAMIHRFHRAVAAGVLATSVSEAQTVLVTGATSARYIELRPFVRDSIASGLVRDGGLLRQLTDGRIVRCVPGEPYCHDVRPGARRSMLPLIQDVNVSVFGLGRGVRVFAQLRGRTAIGEAREIWPQQDDPLEVLALYGEVERGRVRIRGGRQWKVSGLGYYNFDGLAVAWRPTPATWVELYAGRSLVRGLSEARTGEALESIESLSLPDAGVLAGVHARFRPNPRLALGAAYQMDVRGDRTAAYSELAIADGVLRLGAGALEGSVEVDVGGVALNHARLAFRSAPVGRTTLFAEARRYRPYFELWTIWGAFSPVGFDEGRAGLTWASPGARLTGRVETSVRRYGAADTDSPDDYRTSGWGMGVAATWTPRRDWTLDAGGRVESGFGASRWDGQAGIRRAFGGTGSLALHGVVFQRLYEFRLDQSTVFGLGGEGAMPLGDRGRVALSATLFRHDAAGPAPVDWNQRRASLRFEWVLGDEPGNATAGGRR